jgi:predicted dehydrogenase
VIENAAIGVVGLGSIGRRHARLLAERSGAAVPVFDTSPNAADHLPGVRMVADVDALLDACSGVVIATPDDLHAPQTIAACRAGVAVLVEKPLSDSRAGADAMAAAAAATGVPVLVGHVLRHLPVLQRAAELLATGAIGRPVSFHATLGAYETLELARMRFGRDDRYRLPFDYSHEWHYLQWLLGPARRVVAVSHTAGDLPLRQEPNVIEVLLELGTGVTGSVHLDYVERDGARAVRIVGDRGALALDLRAGDLGLRAGSGPVVHESHVEERDAAFRRQLDHFADVIAGANPMVTIDDATRALAVAEAVVASCEQGTWQEVVA